MRELGLGIDEIEPDAALRMRACEDVTILACQVDGGWPQREEEEEAEGRMLKVRIGRR